MAIIVDNIMSDRIREAAYGTFVGLHVPAAYGRLACKIPWKLLCKPRPIEQLAGSTDI